jgi:hypothetical protein
MKRWLLGISFLLSLGVVQAQDSIIEALVSQDSASSGVIEIESDPAITALLGKSNGSSASVRPAVNSETAIVKTKGFRIQAFMDSDRTKSRAEAFNRQGLIRAAFPDTEIYVSYIAPNWRVFVGDFLTREEATAFKALLQREFPEFGKEMYIIADQINIPQTE